MQINAGLTRWMRDLLTMRVIARRRPDFVVMNRGRPYLQRWWLIRRNRVCNIYVHRFLRSDDDRALHDHPWASLTWCLDGGYIEHMRDQVRVVRPGDIVGRRAATAHRVELHTGYRALLPRYAMTLFITGPKIREWGFHCPRGWVHWRDFTAPDDPGSTGPGCA